MNSKIISFQPKTAQSNMFADFTEIFPTITVVSSTSHYDYGLLKQYTDLVINLQDNHKNIIFVVNKYDKSNTYDYGIFQFEDTDTKKKKYQICHSTAKMKKKEMLENNADDFENDLGGDILTRGNGLLFGEIAKLFVSRICSKL
jgi:cobalamin biosynthesis Mg chelatase CobN